MSYLIDRQAVIDLLKQMRKDGDMVPWEGKDVFARIRKLPTIQPEKEQLSCEGTTFDLISRQDAIDAVDAIGHIATMPDGDKCIRRSAVKYTLSMLPPIQPEPHEGHWIEVAGELECSECHTVFTDLYPDYADSVACPHCGTKMTISTK